MPQYFDISVWPIATPSAIIVNTIYIILEYKVHFIYQISEVLFDMHMQVTERKRNYVQYFNGEFHSLVIGDFCASRE